MMEFDERMKSDRVRKLLEKLRSAENTIVSGSELDAIRRKAERAHRPVPIEEALRGKLLKAERGVAWLVEGPATEVHSGVRELEQRYLRAFEQASTSHPESTYHPEVRDCLQAGLERLLFLDIETTGIQAAMVFLVGIMRWTGDGFVIRQFFARDYPEEAAVMESVQQEGDTAGVLVTFNGKTFDLPSLHERARYHRVDFRWRKPHCDLLHEARRQWKNILPNCRLQTLEAAVCGTPRGADIPGWEIPGAYHEYARTGDARKMTAIASHNARDLLAMADILVSVVEGRVPDAVDWADFA